MRCTAIQADDLCEIVGLCLPCLLCEFVSQLVFAPWVVAEADRSAFLQRLLQHEAVYGYRKHVIILELLSSRVQKVAR